MCVCVLHDYRDVWTMPCPNPNMEKRIPLLLVLLYVLTGDYLSLIRHIQLSH